MLSPPPSPPPPSPSPRIKVAILPQVPTPDVHTEEISACQITRFGDDVVQVIVDVLNVQ